MNPTYYISREEYKQILENNLREVSFRYKNPLTFSSLEPGDLFWLCKIGSSDCNLHCELLSINESRILKFKLVCDPY